MKEKRDGSEQENTQTDREDLLKVDKETVNSMKMKRTQPPETDFMEGFGQWLKSEEGLESMDALDCVHSALDGASVDILEKKIIWSDGERLTIEQSAEKIHRETDIRQDAIISHIIGWLQMEYVPEGHDDEQMELFESQINEWLEDYEGNRW